MQDILKTILDALNSVSPDVWTIIIETVVGALVASPLVVGLKKWLSINSDKVMLITTIAASMVAAGGVYIVNDPVFSAWLIPIQGWLIFATTQPVYRFLVKPIIRKIQTVIADAIAFNAEVKSAAVPPSGLPGSTITRE
jgi:hypothetical protein